MKFSRFGCSTLLTAVPLALSAGAAHADLTWEHSGSVSISSMKQPVFKFKLFTNLTPQRSRFMFKYDATSLSGVMPGGMPKGLPGSYPTSGDAMTISTLVAPAPSNAQVKPGLEGNHLVGSVVLVQRFDDGKFIGYTSLSKQYVNESIKDMMTKYRFDPWKSMAPKLSNNEPPGLTTEQRMRLGAEVRAVIAPFLGRMLKTYFRPLPEKRTFNGVEGQGYRLTMLMNGGNPMQGENDWGRLSAEWWVAGTLPGDEVVAQMREAAIKIMGRDPKSSTSMWLNEMPQVAWAMMPEEFHQALYTLTPRPDAPVDSDEFKRAYMPLHMAMTITPPPSMRAKTGGKDETLRMEMNLVRRGEEVLPDRIWDAPADYKRVPLEDIMKDLEKMRPPMPGLPGGPMPSF